MREVREKRLDFRGSSTLGNEEHFESPTSSQSKPLLLYSHGQKAAVALKASKFLPTWSSCSSGERCERQVAG